ncbi:MAG: helix-turn-helix domain-containing protein [Solirubrobacteraceae bacterium]
MQQDDDWLTLPQIAKMLQMNPSTIRLWVSEGRLKAHKAGGRKWLVRRSDLDRLLATRTNLELRSPPPREPPRADANRDWATSPKDVLVDLASSVDLSQGSQ